MKVFVERESDPKGYEEREVLAAPLTVGALREALAGHDDDALVVTEMGDACLGFAKSVEDATVRFVEGVTSMGGDAERLHPWDEEGDEARPEGYWRKAVFIDPTPYWHEKDDG